MATAQEELISIFLFDSGNVSSGVSYTVPTGKFAEVYPQLVRNAFNDGVNSYNTVQVGEVLFPNATDPGGTSSNKNMYATDIHGQGIAPGGNQITQMGRSPITLDQGQTIQHLLSSGAGGSSRIVAVIKLFNRPS